MPERFSYEYAIVRVVPRVDRAEFINVGIIVFAKQQKLLQSRFRIEEPRLRALWPTLDLEAVTRHLTAIERICQGDESASPIAKMSQSERFHWLTAPRSTIIQTSPVRTGLASELESLADHLMRELVHLSAH